jgi:hypothetical protein
LKFKRPRKKWGLVAGLVAALGLVALVSISVALAVTHNTGLFGPHVGADSTTFKHEGDCSSLQSGEVLWHFVLPQTVLPLGSATGALDVTFATSGTQNDVPYTKIAGKVIHWDVITPGDDVLVSAWTDALSTAPPTPDYAIRLSHVCGGGGQSNFDASLATAVHDAAHNDVTNSSVALGTAIHDLATVTEIEGTVDSGTVYFSLFNGTSCGEGGGTQIGSTESVDLGTFNTAEPGGTSLQATSSTTSPNLGAGGYSYFAFADLVGSEPGQSITVGIDGCEPFTVNKADLQISTDIHNAAHQVITSADAGAVVHDTATLSSLVSGFNPDLTKISFTFFTNARCENGTGVNNTGPDPATSTNVARSADSAPLAAGDYSYQASFAGDGNYNPAGPSACEPLHIFRAALTIGYWKTHMYKCALREKTGTNGCNTSGPFTSDYLNSTICTSPNTCTVGKLGDYSANTVTLALAVFNANNCSNASATDANAAACLAAQLLAAELNVANGANTCICSTIKQANDALTAVKYAGPGKPITLSGSGYTRANLISLKTKLDTYNNGGGCPST